MSPQAGGTRQAWRAKEQPCRRQPLAKPPPSTRCSAFVPAGLGVSFPVPAALPGWRRARQCPGQVATVLASDSSVTALHLPASDPVARRARCEGARASSLLCLPATRDRQPSARGSGMRGRTGGYGWPGDLTATDSSGRLRVSPLKRGGAHPCLPAPLWPQGALEGRGPGVSLASGASERSRFCCLGVAALLYRDCCAN